MELEGWFIKVNVVCISETGCGEFSYLEVFMLTSSSNAQRIILQFSLKLHVMHHHVVTLARVFLMLIIQ